MPARLAIYNVGHENSHPLLLTALSDSAQACQAPTPDSLRAAWIVVRTAALQDEPGTSARLYKFPLLLFGKENIALL